MSAILTIIQERTRPSNSKFVKVIRVVASCKTPEQYNNAVQWAQQVLVKELDQTSLAVYLGVLIAKQLEFENGF